MQQAYINWKCQTQGSRLYSTGCSFATNPLAHNFIILFFFFSTTWDKSMHADEL